MSDPKRGCQLSGRGEVLPEPSAKVSRDEFVDLAGIRLTLLVELVDLGWVEPAVTGEGLELFCMRDVYRARKLERLCNDLGVAPLAGSIIVDLLERIDELEAKVRELERLG